MTDEIQQHFTAESRRTELYKRLDTKVQATQFLFDGLYNLPLLSTTDDETAEEQELYGLFQRILHFFPESTRQRYERFTHLFSHSYGTQEATDKIKLQSDTDIQFLQNCNLAIGHALVNRHSARSTLQMIYRKKHSVEEIFNRHHGIQLKGKAMHITPGRFSIHVVLNHATYTAYTTHIRIGDSVGMHHSNTIWNFIDDDPQIYERMAKNLGITPYQFREEALAHEDAHALLESFLPNSVDRGSIDAKIGDFNVRIHRWEREYQKAQHSDDIEYCRRYIRQHKRELRDYVRGIENCRRDEMLAEWSSAPTRTTPRLTYAKVIATIIRELYWHGMYTAAVKPTYERLLSLEKRLKSFHELMENSAPGFGRYLQFALAIIPPSEWRHIPGLIDYWASERRTVATSMAL